MCFSIGLGLLRVCLDFIFCRYFVDFLSSALWTATACDCWLLEQIKMNENWKLQASVTTVTWRWRTHAQKHRAYYYDFRSTPIYYFRSIRWKSSALMISVEKTICVTARRAWGKVVAQMLKSFNCRILCGRYAAVIYTYKCKKLNSLQHLVRTTVAGSHN